MNICRVFVILCTHSCLLTGAQFMSPYRTFLQSPNVTRLFKSYCVYVGPLSGVDHGSMSLVFPNDDVRIFHPIFYAAKTDLVRLWLNNLPEASTCFHGRQFLLALRLMAKYGNFENLSIFWKPQPIGRK